MGNVSQAPENSATGTSCADLAQLVLAGRLTGGPSWIAGPLLCRHGTTFEPSTVVGRSFSTTCQQSGDRQQNRHVPRRHPPDSLPDLSLGPARADLISGLAPEELAHRDPEGAPQLLKHLQRRELFAPLDPADIRKVNPAGNPLGQLSLREPLLEPETPQTFSEEPLKGTLGRHP